MNFIQQKYYTDNLLNALPDGIITMLPDGKISHINLQAQTELHINKEISRRQFIHIRSVIPYAT